MNLPSHPFLRAFFRSPGGTISLVLVAILILDVVLAPSLLGGRASAIAIPDRNQGLSLLHPIGTDELGRDLLARTLVAARTSVLIALGASAIGVLLGLTIGLLTAVSGRRLRCLRERLVDTPIAFPPAISNVMLSSTLAHTANESSPRAPSAASRQHA